MHLVYTSFILYPFFVSKSTGEPPSSLLENGQWLCRATPSDLEDRTSVVVFKRGRFWCLSPVCCKNGHRVINLEVRLPDNAGENSYQAAFEEHRWSWKGKLGEEHDELRREQTPREAQSLCWEGW